jgi:hypothetical protein
MVTTAARMACVTLLVLGGSFVTGAPAAAKSASMADCFADLERGTATDIVCEFPLRPSPVERAEMEKQTSGYLKDATCVVSIRIARAAVAAAIETPDYQFDAPPQPVACKITMPGKTGDTITDVTGTFAPKVTIKNGLAVQATPGLGDVKGVSRVIAWPAVAYINRAGFLRDGMIKVVNAWMAHMRSGKSKIVTR